MSIRRIASMGGIALATAFGFVGSGFAAPTAAAAGPACGRVCTLTAQNAGQTFDIPAGSFAGMTLDRPTGTNWSSISSNLPAVEVVNEQNPPPEWPPPPPPRPGSTPPPFVCPQGPYGGTVVTVNPGTASITATATCSTQPCPGPLRWTISVGPALTRNATPTPCSDQGGAAGFCNLTGQDAGLTLALGQGFDVMTLSGTASVGSGITWTTSDPGGDLLDLNGDGSLFVPIRAGQDTATAVGTPRCPGPACGGPQPHLTWYLDIAAAPNPASPSPPGTDCDTESGCPLESFNIGGTVSETLSSTALLALRLYEGKTEQWSTTVSDPTVLSLSAEHHDPSTWPAPTYTATLTPIHSGSAKVTSTLVGTCGHPPCPALLTLTWWVVASPPGPPGAPTSVLAFAGQSGISVTWAPGQAHGAQVQAYAIYAFSYTGAPKMFESTGVALQTSGLTSGAYYTFTVTGYNSFGWGPWSRWSPWALQP